MSSLFPDGISSLADLPHPLHDAIVLALRFLSFDELPSDERPPRSIWLAPKEMEKHFKAVDKRRDEKYGTGKGGGKEIDDPVQNEAASMLVSGGDDD